MWVSILALMCTLFIANDNGVEALGTTSCVKRSAVLYTSDTSTFTILSCPSFATVPPLTTTVFASNISCATAAPTSGIQYGTFEGAVGFPFSTSNQASDTSGLTANFEVTSQGPFQPHAGNQYLLVTFSDDSGKRDVSPTTGGVFNLSQPLSDFSDSPYTLSLYARAGSSSGSSPANCTVMLCDGNTCSNASPLSTDWTLKSHAFVDGSPSGTAIFSVWCAEPAYVGFDNIAVNPAVAVSNSQSTITLTSVVYQNVTQQITITEQASGPTGINDGPSQTVTLTQPAQTITTVVRSQDYIVNTTTYITVLPASTVYLTSFAPERTTTAVGESIASTVLETLTPAPSTVIVTTSERTTLEITTTIPQVTQTAAASTQYSASTVVSTIIQYVTQTQSVQGATIFEMSTTTTTITQTLGLTATLSQPPLLILETETATTTAMITFTDYSVSILSATPGTLTTSELITNYISVTMPQATESIQYTLPQATLDVTFTSIPDPVTLTLATTIPSLTETPPALTEYSTSIIFSTIFQTSFILVTLPQATQSIPFTLPQATVLVTSTSIPEPATLTLTTTLPARTQTTIETLISDIFTTEIQTYTPSPSTQTVYLTYTLPVQTATEIRTVIQTTFQSASTVTLTQTQTGTTTFDDVRTQTEYSSGETTQQITLPPSTTTQYTTVLSTTTASCTSSAACQPPISVPNGGFEDGVASPWQVNGPCISSGITGNTNRGVLDGQYALAVTSTCQWYGGPFGGVSLNNQQLFSIYASHGYSASFAMMVNATDWTGQLLVYLDIVGGPTSNGYYQVAGPDQFQIPMDGSWHIYHYDDWVSQPDQTSLQWQFMIMSDYRQQVPWNSDTVINFYIDAISLYDKGPTC